MQRFAFACLCLALSGCSYNTWSDLSFTTGSNPNLPVGNSENMRRVMGVPAETEPLTPEPGDIWPGPLAPPPTLQDLEREGLQPQPERAVPGSPDYQPQQPQPQQQPQQPPQRPNQPAAPTARGSSTPPGSTQPGLARLPPPSAPPPVNTTPPGPNPAGQVYQTPTGPAVTSGGTSKYQTTTTPGGGSAIIVPNGNGTSTIIHSDGTIQTVPTPR